MLGTRHRRRLQTDLVDPKFPAMPMLFVSCIVLFFCTVTYRQPSNESKIELTLPEDKNGIPNPAGGGAPPVLIVVEVRSDNDGQIASITLRIEVRNLPKEQIGKSVEALKKSLSTKYDEFKRTNTPTELRFEVSEDIPWVSVVKLIDINRQIGFTGDAPTLLPNDRD